MTQYSPALLAVLALAACGSSKVIQGQIDDNLFLRSSMDEDPSTYLGRFVAEGVEVPNESAASPTACSGFVHAKRIAVPGVARDFVYEAHTKVGLGVAIPGTGQGRAEFGKDESLRIKYRSTGKLVAQIDDPIGFEACCAEAEERCTGRYVGEFIQGTGEIYVVQRKGVVGKAKGSGGGVIADGSLDKGEVWSRSTQFDNAYFAFRTTENLQSGCPASDPKGDLAVWTGWGQGPDVDAKKQARADARSQLEASACAGLSSERCSGIVRLIQPVGDARWDQKTETACVSVGVPTTVLEDLEQDVAAVELELLRAAQALVEASPATVSILPPVWSGTQCEPSELGSRLTSSFKANLAGSEIELAAEGKAGAARLRTNLDRVADTVRATVELVDESGEARVLSGMAFAADAFGFDPGNPEDCDGGRAGGAPPRIAADVRPRWRGEKSGYEMVQPPSGHFTMGSPTDEPLRLPGEGPVEVAISRPYWIGTLEVNQDLWKNVMGKNPAIKRQQRWGDKAQGSCAKAGPLPLVAGTLPVHCVGWRESLRFANALSKYDGLKPVYTLKKSGEIEVDARANGYRLPTEAEWEYAARAGQSGTWGHAQWRSQVCELGNVADRAYQDRYGGPTNKAFACQDGSAVVAPGGSYLANAWGIHDMQGNVFEWVWDAWGSLEPGVDPLGADAGSLRVYRGGSWTRGPAAARIASRQRGEADQLVKDLGLRLVRQVPLKGKEARLESKRWAGDAVAP